MGPVILLAPGGPHFAHHKKEEEDSNLFFLLLSVPFVKTAVRGLKAKRAIGRSFSFLYFLFFDGAILRRWPEKRFSLKKEATKRPF